MDWWGELGTVFQSRESLGLGLGLRGQAMSSWIKWGICFRPLQWGGWGVKTEAGSDEVRFCGPPSSSPPHSSQTNPSPENKHYLSPGVTQQPPEEG